MLLFDILAEKHIVTALARGELDNLPNQGKPQVLDDDSMVPAELRASYRLLKNANCLPPELELRKEIRQVEDLLSHLDANPVRQHEQQQDQLQQMERRLSLLKTRLAMCGHDVNLFEHENYYREKLRQRLAAAPVID